jgi:protein involved in polysaccharide export with SLBB domain
VKTGVLLATLAVGGILCSCSSPKIAADISTQTKPSVIVPNELPAKVFLIGLGTRDTEIPYAPGLTLAGAISEEGGFTDFSRRKMVRVIRCGQIHVVNLEETIRDSAKDFPLEAWDVIYATKPQR